MYSKFNKIQIESWNIDNNRITNKKKFINLDIQNEIFLALQEWRNGNLNLHVADVTIFERSLLNGVYKIFILI